MNIISRPLLATGVCVWLLGVAFTPALAATTPSPVVDQAPLIIQKALPPNIVLMLDDSGSMAWDVMPDWSYLSSTSADALVNSDVNGVYFNPTTTYTPPIKADGTSYANADFNSALTNGFDSSSTKVDLSSYDGSSDVSRNGTSKSDLGYSINVGASSSFYAPTDCTASGNKASQTYVGYCYYSNYTNQTYSFTANGYYYFSRCNAGDAYFGTQSSGQCASVYRKFFTYTTRDTSGAYTRHYVSKTTGDCALVGLSSTTCDETAKTRQNVANWFTYYHTRILMAKSGVMNAFSSVDSTFRIGFGSINGNNDSNLPTLNDKYGSNDNRIAKVVPFGDGSSGSQKASFWSWVAGSKANNSTPLRRSLDAVGRYYTTDQPWQTSASDTNELACRQSYTILTTDGFWNGGNPNVDNVDNTAAGPITGPSNEPYSYNPAPPYSDGNSNTLADVAMKYWVTDLRTASNEVPTSKEDPAFWQHMVTFTLGLGFSPVNISGNSTADDDIFAWANGGSAIANFSWPTPSADNINNIADLEHAAVNGHGGFASAKTPDEFNQALKKALQRASDRVGTGASLAANSTQLKTGAFAYQANYYTGNWKGDLKAIVVDPNSGALALTPTWTASSKMPAASSRNIYTYNPSVTPVAAVAFNATSGLSSAEQTALGSDATTQLNMINYLRGDASKEKSAPNGIYRTRETPLGDIVDSQPVYAGQPDANQFVGQSFTGSDTYASFAASTRATTAQGLLFVAANDGMLHAFNADTGAEGYAYLPAAVITTNSSTTGRTTGDLATLADPDYGTTTAVPHQFFNDGELTVADVYFGTAWHSVAVGTTGRGLAKAIYALDVTDPANIKLLWERSAGDGKANADFIGQMTGKPVIAQTNDAGTADSTGNGNWSVLIGNGYNSKNGTAALLQFAIKDGTLSVHATDSTTGNGLAAPAVWLDDLSTGISTSAYAGDAKGRVWSFLLNAIVKSGNGSNAVYTPTPYPSSAGVKLFTATDGTNAQPITAGMLVGKNSLTQDLWVFFGTGQYLSNSDLATRTTQSWYGLIVKSATAGLAADGTNSVTRSSLKQRSIIAETLGNAEVLNADGTVKTAAISPARAVTAAPSSSDMAGKSGWYMDLLSPTSTTAGDGTVTYTANQTAEGERIVTPNQFQGNQLLATTRIPEAVDLCNPSGRGWIMAVDPFTGTNPKSSFFDLNGDGQINQPADYIMVNGTAVATSGIGFSSLPNNPIFMGGSMLVSFDNGGAISIKTSGTSNTLQRVSWRELIAQ
jgi:type IV pilus assembly protein PilY1